MLFGYFDRNRAFFRSLFNRAVKEAFLKGYGFTAC